MYHRSLLYPAFCATFVVLLALAITPRPSFAQQASTSATPMASNSMQESSHTATSLNQASSSPQATATTSTYSGEVTSVDQSSITVKAGTDAPKSFALSGSGIKVTRNGANAALTDLQTHDQATITTDEQGHVVSIDAFSNAASSWKIWIIPLILLGLLLIGLTAYLARKATQGHIRTTPTKVA